jgi:hypothetical protein
VQELHVGHPALALEPCTQAGQLVLVDVGFQLTEGLAQVRPGERALEVVVIPVVVWNLGRGRGRET